MAVTTSGVRGTQREFANQDLLCRRVFENYIVAPTAITTAGAATYTAAQVLGGIILRDPAGAARTDVLPTAALLIAALPDARIGDIIRCLVINNGDGTDETITINAGSGGTIPQVDGSQIIPQETSRELIIRLTVVAPGSEAYVVYM